MKGSAQLVVSYYDRRPVEHLYRLLDSMQQHSAGCPYQVCIVVNCSSDTKPELDLHDYQELNIDIHYRPNLGMNIGAWDAGWRLYPDADYFLFLQYDCYIARDSWLSAFADKLADSSVGLVGECSNAQWNCSWDELHKREANTELAEHFIDGKPANRVDVYRQFLQQNNIEAGDNGAHLRALSWAVRRDTLLTMNGFPIGKNFGECIGAEIAVSRHVCQLGLSLQTTAEVPFHYIRHIEWNQSEPGGEFNKHNTTSIQMKRLEQENQRLNASLTTVKKLLAEPRWKLARSLVSGKLKQNICSALEKK